MGSKRYDAKVDIFAIACILYELATGKQLFPSVMDYGRSITMNSSIMSDPATVAEFVKQMVQIDPRERPTAVDVLKSCSKFLEHLKPNGEKSDPPIESSVTYDPIATSQTLSWAPPRASGKNTLPSFEFSGQVGSTTSSIHACVVNRQNALIAVQSYELGRRTMSTVLYDNSGQYIWGKKSWDSTPEKGEWRIPPPVFSEDGQFLALCDSRCRAEILDIKRLEYVDYTAGITENIAAVAVGTNGKNLAIAVYQDRKMDPSSATTIRSPRDNPIVKINSRYRVAGMAYTSGDRVLVLIGSDGGHTHIESWERGKIPQLTTWYHSLRPEEPILYPLQSSDYPVILQQDRVPCTTNTWVSHLWTKINGRWEFERDFSDSIPAIRYDQLIRLGQDGSLVLTKTDGSAVAEVPVGKIEGGLPPLNKVKGVALSDTSVTFVLGDGNFLLYRRD